MSHSLRRTIAASLIVGFGVVAGTVGATGRARAADSDPVFAVGVLRRDAIVVPFANYDGKKWHADWPEARKDSDVPVNLRSVPSGWWGRAGVRETWQAWIGKESPQLVTVLQPDWFPAYCLRAVGLRTDYHAREPAPPHTVRPYPTDGLAVSPAQPIQRIDLVPQGDSRRFRLAATIFDSFNRTEREIADEEHHPIPRAVRESVRPVIEAMYAAHDGSVVYIEAAREYQQPDDPSACRAVSFGGGWYARGSDGNFAPLQTYVQVLDCDRDGASYMLPLGIMHLSNHTFWLAQFSGWDNAQYEVDEIKPKTVDRVLTRSAGGC